LAISIKEGNRHQDLQKWISCSIEDTYPEQQERTRVELDEKLSGSLQEFESTHNNPQHFILSDLFENQSALAPILGEAVTLSEAEYEARLAESAREAAVALAALPPLELPLDQAKSYTTRWADSFNRMGMVLSLRNRMDEGDWLTLLGEEWDTCDNIWQHMHELRRVLGSVGPLLPMMTPEEQVVYAALPNRLTIYRGCSARRLTGASWSLDREVARRFPSLNRYRVEDPVLVIAKVWKHDVLAFKSAREEQEIITFKARRLCAPKENPTNSCREWWGQMLLIVYFTANEQLLGLRLLP
jgi:hypothetical protein